MHPSGTAQPTGAPIYDRLVAERGDVPGDVRLTAETILKDTARALDFRRPAFPPPGRQVPTDRRAH